MVIGYCFGGAAALELARSGKAEGVKGYVTFHGGLKTPEGESYPAGTPPLLILHGGADTSITMEDVAALSRELEAANLPYEIQVYSGAPHGFTIFGAEAYRQDADEKSWAAFTDSSPRSSQTSPRRLPDCPVKPGNDETKIGCAFRPPRPRPRS